MGSNWDYNVLMILPSGDEKDQQVIRTDKYLIAARLEKHQHSYFYHSKSLQHKAPVPMGPIVVEAIIEPGEKEPKGEDKHKFTRLNDELFSRLTIFGHGTKSSTSVGGRTPQQLANLLKIGCGVKRVGKISLVACYAGGNNDGKVPTDPWNSFAAEFFAELGAGFTSFGLSARNRALGTNKNGLVSFVEGKEIRKAPKSKVLFTWDMDSEDVKLRSEY